MSDLCKSKNSQLFNIFYNNADQLTNKTSELQQILEQENIDIAVINETLPKNPIFEILEENNFKIPGYVCKESTKGRGVCIFIKDNIEFMRHTDIEDIFKPSVFLKINLPAGDYINIGIIYRSPNCSNLENDQLNTQLKLAFKNLKNLIVFGDFNYPQIDWENNHCNKKRGTQCY